jgi:hypothetical protein
VTQILDSRLDDRGTGTNETLAGRGLRRLTMANENKPSNRLVLSKETVRGLVVRSAVKTGVLVKPTYAECVVSKYATCYATCTCITIQSRPNMICI